MPDAAIGRGRRGDLAGSDVEEYCACTAECFADAHRGRKRWSRAGQQSGRALARRQWHPMEFPRNGSRHRPGGESARRNLSESPTLRLTGSPARLSIKCLIVKDRVRRTHPAARPAAGRVSTQEPGLSVPLQATNIEGITQGMMLRGCWLV